MDLRFVERSQHPSHDLAGARGRHGLDELDLAWHFVRSERVPAELDDLVLGHAGALFEHDVCLGELALHLVFDAADGNEGNSGMAGQDTLDLCGVHVEPSRENHVLLPIDDEDAAVLVHPCQIAGVEPPIGFDRFARHCFVTEVALHDDRATHHQLADVDDAATTLATNEVGELMVRGPVVMQGYFGNEEMTRETIEPDGWLHTGDLARMDEDGCIFIVDRKKDMILTAGFNVYPAEIERVLAGHPAVALVAVGSVDDEMKGELAKAYIVLKEGASATETEIIDFCRDSLAAYKVPRRVQFVESVPTTSSGKIMRRMLRTLDDS